MGLLAALKNIGTRLRIIQAVPAKDGGPPRRVSTRMASIDELGAELRSEEVRALAQLPAELSVAFEKVFEAAGIKTDTKTWTIERLRDLLKTEQFRSMDRTAVQKAVLGLLSAEKALVEDLVKDAVARDKAIDAFESFVRKKMEERRTARERRIAEIETQVRQLKDECSRLREETKVDQEQFGQWRRRKTAYEREMAWAVNYLVEGQVVTIDSDTE